MQEYNSTVPYPWETHTKLMHVRQNCTESQDVIFESVCISTASSGCDKSVSPAYKPYNILLWPHWSQRIWQSNKDYAMFEPTYTSFSGYEKCKGLSRVEGTAAWWNVLNNVLWATTHYHGIVAEESNFVQIARGEWAAALESHLWLLTCDVILKHNYAPTMCIWFEYLDDC